MIIAIDTKEWKLADTLDHAKFWLEASKRDLQKADEIGCKSSLLRLEAYIIELEQTTKTQESQS